MMTRLRHTLLFASLSLAVPAFAAAQSPQSSPSSFAGVLGGLTFGTSTGGAVAGNAGIEVAPNLFVVGEIGYMRNVMPNEIQNLMDDIGDALESEIGLPVQFDVSMPQFYGFGGVRWILSPGRLSPFVEGGIGAGRISFKIDRAEVLGLDLRDIVEDAIGEAPSSTEFLLAVGAGVNVAVSSAASVDLGARYTRLATQDPSVNTAMVYGAFKFSR